MSLNRKKTVLLIDDSQFMRDLIKRILIKYEFRIVGEAENGIIGAEKYRYLKPDIVTLDLNMDDADGLATLDLIMNHDPNATIVMISSTLGQPVLAERVKAKGAKAIILKPVDEKKLIDTLRSVTSLERYDQ